MKTNNVTKKHRQSEFGDFQTPFELARKVCRWLKTQGVIPEVLVEPTCGRGNFILAALETFPTLKYVYGIEIYEPYLIQTQQKIETLCNERNAVLQLIQDNVFEYPFEKIAERHRHNSLLVLGNPPWVTNAQLSKIDSQNVPQKSNIKKVKGLDAMTGKGNFDIGECVTLTMLKTFAHSKGHFAFLVKNNVTKNIIHSQKQFLHPIGNIQQINIDAKKEFNVSVDAGLFFATFGTTPSFDCALRETLDGSIRSHFGWFNEKFVADRERYRKSEEFDGVSPMVWRQGIKHDCHSAMDLTLFNHCYNNPLGEVVDIEDELVYPFLKSSDLKERIISKTKRAVLVPQKYVGQCTDYLQTKCPKTYHYLEKHKNYFEQRKSVIYKDKPPFSIFGIGDYSFKPYKVAISGLYKQTQFSLVLPMDDKPVMLDDTCYFLGFDSLPEAEYVVDCLNQTSIQNLLQSLVFWNGKRVITKDILMRLDYQRNDPCYVDKKYRKTFWG